MIDKGQESKCYQSKSMSRLGSEHTPSKLKSIPTKERISVLAEWRAGQDSGGNNKTLTSTQLAVTSSFAIAFDTIVTATVIQSIDVRSVVLAPLFLIIFVMLLFPSRSVATNIFSLVYKNSRRVMKGVPLSSRTYRNCVVNQKLDDRDRVTVMIPVFTESFSVIKHTILSSLIEATTTGENVNVVVCDDSLMYYTNNVPLQDYFDKAITVEDSAKSPEQCHIVERMTFYNSLIVSYKYRLSIVSRPWTVPGYPQTHRRGTFKKAGNLNFAHKLFDTALALGKINQFSLCSALNSLLGEFASSAYVKGDLYIGDYIVLLDKDSTIPKGAINQLVPDFKHDDSLSFIQSAIRADNADENSFSRVTAYFYEQEFAIKYAMEAVNGAVSFVGHSAVVRKSHLQQLGYWSEEHVSEDLSLSMELTALGYHGKFVDLKEMRFGEHVPVALEEEAKRYGRYAYGGAQLVFNPIKDWYTAGILTTHIRKYLRSSHLPWYCKFDVVIHLTSFISMSLLLPITLASIFLPNLILATHSSFALVLFFASSIKIVPSAFYCSDVAGKAKGSWCCFYRYVTYTMPKIPIDLFLSHVVCRNYLDYFCGIKPNHGVTNVDKFVVVPLHDAISRIGKMIAQIADFTAAFIVLSVVAQVTGLRAFDSSSYALWIAVLLVISPAALSPELRAGVKSFGRRPKRTLLTKK